MNCQKHLFSLPDNVRYLNCAYMSPLLKSVEEAGMQGIRSKNNPSEVQAKDFFEPVNEIRNLYAKLIDCPSADRIAMIPSVSYGMANVAFNTKLEKGDEVILIEEQFPSNYYIWKRAAEHSQAKVTVIKDPGPGENRGKVWTIRLLQSISQKTAVVTMPIFHWADGTRFDINRIREATRKNGAILILDGTQSIGAYPFSVHEIQPDALICAAYKFLMGPYSTGLAYYGPYFDAGIPIEESWMNRMDSDDFSNLVIYQSQYRDLARKYEVGESSNFIFTPMLRAALTQLLEWTPENIQKYCEQITFKALKNIKEKGYQLEDPKWRGSHLFGVRLPRSINQEELYKKLRENQIFVSIRGNSIRISPHVYNIEEDLLKLAEIL